MKDYILIVDDYLPVCRLIQEILMGEGLTSQIVESGKECLEYSFSEEPPALILLDWHMPGMRGLEVLKTLKNCAKTRDIPVIMVTGIPGVEEISLESGAQAVVFKPMDFRELTDAIHRCLGTRVEHGDRSTVPEEHGDRSTVSVKNDLSKNLRN